MNAPHIRTFAKFSICILIGATFSSVAAFAWTGPTQTAPNGNVSPPLNVGTTDQTKNAGLGINSLAVFGNAILSTVNGYLNFGTTVGSGGYGLRDNAGTMEFKNTGGDWQGIGSGGAAASTDLSVTFDGMTDPVSVSAKSAGISGVAKQSTGLYRIAFISPMPDTKYLAIASSDSQPSGANTWPCMVNKHLTYVDVATCDTPGGSLTFYDSPDISVFIRLAASF